MIDDEVLKQILLKCGRYISRIIHTPGNEKLINLDSTKLPEYISEYCYNVTCLELSSWYPWNIATLAKNCKKIKALRLLLQLQYPYKKELKKLFEVNKDLERIVLFGCFITSSLTKLPANKMKTIKLADFNENPNKLRPVNMTQFFSYPAIIIYTFHSCRS